MKDLKKINEPDKVKTYQASDKDNQLTTFLSERIAILKATKEDILNGFNFESLMKLADREYQPKDLAHTTNASTLITVEGEPNGSSNANAEIVDISLAKDKANWRSTASEPTLLIKIQTALSILIDQNPEAVLKATCEKYEKRNNVAKAFWKRNWELTGGLEVLKLFVFDLAKYGFAVGHTLPRILKRDKEILEVLDTERPENNKYKKIQIVEFNDIYREKLDLYRTWIDDKANLTDPFSINDWYYEKDYSLEDFKEEFGMYKNSETVTGSSLNELADGNSATKSRKDMVTVGFYENKKKDLYAIWIPGKENTVLYYSPLPNDDGKLTLWYGYWLERDPRTIYGIGLYELLKNNKVMYDRFSNMDIDQLTMAIYPMIFYTGVPMDGNEQITISPDKLVKKQAGTSIEQIKIQYDTRAPEKITDLKERMDDATGITPTLQGDVQGKTLGEVLHAKDSALKRLNIPLLNIAKAIEMDAYITLSWMNQVYSIPEVKEFLNSKELQDYESENNTKANNIQNKGGDKIEAQFYPSIDLGLEEDRDGNLIESPERRFFTLGEGKLPLESIKWEGKITIKAKSIISPNPELERQRKLELYNVIAPQVQMMASLFYQHVDPKTGEAYTPEGGKEVALALYKPAKEILDIQDEKPENWIFKELVDMAENPEILEAEKQAQMEAEKKKPENSLFVDQSTLEEGSGGSGATVPSNGQAQTVVAPSSISNPLRQAMGAAQGAETKAASSF